MVRRTGKRGRAFRHPQRRGIVLLIIISVLLLFMLMLVTFAVVSSHYRDAAKAFAYRRSLAAEEVEGPHLLDSVVMQLLREPSTATSSLWGSGLLSDFYGDSVNGVLFNNAAAEPTTGTGLGTFASFQATTDASQTFGNAQFANISGYHVGCVLTMKDGPCAGLSTRITHYGPGDVDNAVIGTAADRVIFQVEAFENGLTPQAGNHFVVNGKPFNGTGIGRPPATGSTPLYDNSHPGDSQGTAAVGDDFEWALQPHLAAWGNRVNAQAALAGGADEPYDTFCFQNMFLAMVPTDPNAPATPPGAATIMPSFHRQDLIRYWDDRIPSGNGNGATLYAPANIGLARQVTFRPLPEDHPNFTGSNPYMTPGALESALAGYSGNVWDVDNDGDGVPDSIWIDPGLPVATGPDGRKYKRLVALMVRDQDSRINANAAGHSEWLQGYARPETQLQGPLAGNANNTNLNLARGLAYGPAEINFLNLFRLDGENLAVGSASYRRLLQGTNGAAGTDAIPGRYGLDGALANMQNRRPGIWGPNGATVSNDPLSVIKTQGHGLLYNGPTFSNYATPPDVWGRGALALDYAGQPYTFNMGQAVDWLADGTQITAEVNDNPYEINLLDQSASSDTPYTVAELEAVLRRFDVDAANLPLRLFNALQPGAGVGFPRRASLLTTLGSHVPAPRGGVPRYMYETAALQVEYGRRPDGSNANATAVGTSILDVALARIQRETRIERGIAAGMPGPAESEKQDILRQIMPFELFHGQMFDINRPFGNGADDNGNGVVDEPGETDHVGGTFENAWTNGAFSGQGSAFPLNDGRANWWSPPTAAPPANFNVYNAPTYLDYLDGDPHTHARQLYARNLYCLLLLLSDPTYNGAYTEGAVTGNTALARKLLCRRLAQYAINAVDYRDPDAIMSYFEYDEEPFDGWHVDGNLRTNENDTLANGSPNAAGWLPDQVRQVVWGMEYPDLQLTESLAMHDRRAKDTVHDDAAAADPSPQTRRYNMGSMMFEDEDLDQYGLPQGSLFLEFMCARNRVLNNPKLPLELYDPSGALDLGRLAPQRAFGGTNARHPVWRAIVTENPDEPTTMTPSTMHAFAAAHPDTAVFEPSTLGVATERIIWFTPLDPTGTPEADIVFYERTGTLPNIATTPAGSPAASNVLVAPGQYVVAAPRPDTRLGALIDGSDGNPNTYEASPLRFAVAGNAFSTGGGTAGNGFNPYPSPAGTPIGAVRGIVCSANPPAGWADQTRAVGMNISEPLPTANYYPEPTLAGDTYADINAPYTMGTNELPDEPFDDDMAYDGPLYNDMTYGVQTGTREDFRAVFVQRLANPLFPWNPMPDDPEFGASYTATLPINPYISIDWNTLDLTVFNGDENTNQEPGGAGMGWIDPSDEDPYNSDPPERFAGRERGRRPDPMVDPADARFWRNVVNDDLEDTDTDSGAVDHHFQRAPDTIIRPQHTLGYLNRNMGTPQTPTPLAGYEGYPAGGFPWLTWNNRPFANPAELMLVPSSLPSRLGIEFGFGNSVDDTTSPYAQNVAANSLGETYSGHFGHLLPFFNTTDRATGTRNLDLYRLFDYVETPSPYVGTERWYTPGPLNDDPNTAAFDPPAYGVSYRAPFNKLSRFRDPGRVNIGTMVDPEVWNAIVATDEDLLQAPRPALPAGSPLPDGPFARMLRSRRGYDDTSNELLAVDTAFPSAFSNPLRPADAHDLMPLANMQRPRPVDATLLRRPIAGGMDPLLDNMNHRVAGGAATNYYRATDRNAAFRYQPYTKLANMLTTTSNTFAVWETIGYFEVEPNPGGVDVAHPDGYRLGAEMRFDDGTVKRPRAFYLIDRSIPVGFEPGQNHNVDRCILLRRYLE